MSDLNKNEKVKDENFIGNLKASFSGRKFRTGAYTTMVSVIVVVLVLLVNLIVTEIDMKYDLSTQDFYTLTDKTLEFVEDIEDDVTIYYLAETGNEMQLFQKIVERYSAISGNINVEKKDPILYPNFVSQYVDAEVSQNSVLVVNNDTGRARYVDYNDMLIQEFSYELMDFYITGIDVEGKITSAIQYVTNPDLPVIYTVQGHGEKEHGEGFTKLLERQNISLQNLSTLTIDQIPEECDILFINSPEYDFTPEEVALIREYMENGGDLILVLDYMSNTMENFNSLLEYYGVSVVEGIVFEGNSSRHVPNNPHFIVPNMLDHSITSDILSERNKFVITPLSSGLQKLDNTRSSLQFVPLLETSDAAYSKVDIYSQTLDREEGDVAGPFYVGIIATDTYQNVTSNLIVYTSELIFEDSSIQSYGNGDLLLSSINHLTGETTSLSIKTRSMRQEFLRLTQNQAYLWGALTIIVIPVIVLVVGIIVSVRRRRR